MTLWSISASVLVHSFPQPKETKDPVSMTITIDLEKTASIEFPISEIDLLFITY